MRVSAVPATAKIFYRYSTDKLSKQIKKINDKDLAQFIKQQIDNIRKENDKTWKFAYKTLHELNIRDYSKKNFKELLVFQTRFELKAENCIVSPYYSIEIAGIKRKAVDPQSSHKKIIHPYPRSQVAKKVIHEWKNHHSSETLEDYINHHVSDSDKEALKKRSVKYLSTKDQDEYHVTFSHTGEVKIGGKGVSDGIYIFALSNDGRKLLAGQKKKGEFQHTSFFAGDPVQCAGKFTIRDKKIMQVVLKSGHYKPTAIHGTKLQKFLSNPQHLGFMRTQQLVIKTYDGVILKPSTLLSKF